MASFTVTINGVESQKFKSNKGVLQGKLASPTLLNLYINDITRFLRSCGVTGVDIDSDTILYADDLVVLTTTPNMAQKALNALNRYCIENEMKINKNKTKVVIFRAGGKPKRP